MQAAEQHSPRPQQRSAEGLATPPGQQQQQQVEDELRSAAVKMRLELPLKERCAGCAGCHIMRPNCPAARTAWEVAISRLSCLLQQDHTPSDLQVHLHRAAGSHVPAAARPGQQPGGRSGHVPAHVVPEPVQEHIPQGGVFSRRGSVPLLQLFSRWQQAKGQVRVPSSTKQTAGSLQACAGPVPCASARMLCRSLPSQHSASCRPVHRRMCHAILCRADVSSHPATAGSPAASPPQDCTRRLPKSARQQLSPSKTSSCR